MPILSKPVFYVLQWTWGLLANIIGLCYFLFSKILYKSTRVGYDVLVPMNKGWGLSLGMFIFGEESTAPHEHGHSFQNAILGPFFLTVVALPSVIRFWVRESQLKKNKKLKPYDSIWFEGQATVTGKEFWKK